MQEYWINPIAWSPRLVDQLLSKGWKSFQLDLEGGLFSEETIAWIIDYFHCQGARLIVRVPGENVSLVRKLAKYGVKRFLAPGLATTEALADYARVAREESEHASVIAMIESRAWLEKIDAISDITGVSGVHFGLVDLFKEMEIAHWRDPTVIQELVTTHSAKAAARGLRTGTYMLPQWRNTLLPSQFDVLSYVLSDFADCHSQPGSAYPQAEK